MSKFLSGRQSNLKLGVAGYTESKTVLETTGKVGIGTTDAQSYSLFVVGDTNVTGLVSATAFYGDGSNLENTGATLSAAAGTQRLVVTSLTSGTMVDAATDSDLTFNATTNTLNTDNLIVAGNLTVSGDQTILNTTQLEVEDINIGIASANPKLNNAQLDGAGITIHGLNGDKTLTWDNSNSRLGFNTDLYAPNFFVGDITASGDVDIDGHTELDQLRVSGVSTFNSQINLNANLDMGSNDFIKVGDGDELLIYFDSLDTQILNTGGGYLNITNSNERVNIRAVYNEDGIVVKPNGSVELYYDNSKKFETTSYGAKIYNDLNVGTGVTIYGNAGIVSAISFYGDGSNLTNTGATLSATSGVERLVTTQLTSGTMVDAATDADLTFNATTNLLHTPKIDVAGLSPDGTTFGTNGYVPVADGSGGWNWATLQGASSVNTILNGFSVSEEGNLVGTAGSITQLDFRGVNILATAAGQPNGIATITMSETPTFEQINITGITTLGGPVTAGSSEGVLGQYLRHVGTGVTWASFPQLRVTQTNNATAGQTTFNFTYNIDFLDVFVNGVKLTSSEYSANNGSQIVLNTPAFAGEVIEFHSYNVASTYGSGGGGGGASNLSGLSDVNFPIALADKQLLQFNSSTNVWENISAATVVGAASSFATKVSTATTATAGQTTFSGTYTVGFVDVFLNGVKQSEDQYTASTGTNIVLDEGASEDDIVEVVGLTANVPGSGGGGSSYTDTDVDSHLNVSSASSGQILSWNGSDYAWVADQTGGGGGGGISTHDVRTNSLEVYTGVSTFVGYAATFAAQFKNNVFIDAGAYAMFGNSIDKFSIRNTVGKSQLISGQNGGNVEILSQQSGSVIKIGKYSGGANDIALFTVDAGVELFHNTAKKFETLGAGVTVTGTTFSNELSVVGYSTFKGRVVFDEILEFRGLEIGGANTLDFYDSGSVLRHSIGYDGTHFTVGGGDSVKIDSSLAGDVKISRGGVGIATFTESGLNVTGVVTATSFSGSGAGLTGIVTSIVAGTNVTVSNTGGTYTINSSGGSSGPDPVMMGMIF